MAELVPSQSAVASTKVPALFLIMIITYVISDPMFYGIVHLISTFSPFAVRVGYEGVEGYSAARMYVMSLYSLQPLAF